MNTNYQDMAYKEIADATRYLFRLAGDIGRAEMSEDEAKILNQEVHSLKEVIAMFCRGTYGNHSFN